MPRKRRKREQVQTPAVEESAVAELREPDDVTCPKSEAHGAGRFYHAEGDEGFFVCNVCGHSWTAPVRYTESLTDFCLELAEAIEKAPTQKESDGVEVIVWPVADARESARALRRLARDDPQEVSPSDVRRYRIGVRQRPGSPPPPSLADPTAGEPTAGGLFGRFRRLLPGGS